MAAGSVLFGSGVVARVAAVMYEAAEVHSFAYVFMGAGGALFARGCLGRVPGSRVLVYLGACGLLAFSAFLLAVRRDRAFGLPMAMLALSALVALFGATVLAVGSGEPGPGLQKFK